MVELNGTLLIQILNFVILVAILAKVAYGPMMKVLDDRRARIQNDLNTAASARSDAKKLKESYEAQLRDAQVRAQDIVNKAVKEAQAQAQVQMDEVRHAIAKEKDAASRQIEQERQDALRELKGQVAELSCEIASKIIGQHMTAAANDRLVADSLAKMDIRKAGK